MIAELPEHEPHVQFLSQKGILLEYDSFEELLESLDSCFDLYDLGYVDKSTQYAYLSLYELKGVDLYSLWKEARRSGSAY